MKTYWLVGRNGTGETAQSYMSFVGGSHPIAIHTESDDATSHHSTLGNINLQMKTTTVSEEDEKTLNGADEGNEIINPQKDCPVAYYGHVPHTPANGGVHFKWEEKVGNFCGIIF